MIIEFLSIVFCLSQKNLLSSETIAFIARTLNDRIHNLINQTIDDSTIQEIEEFNRLNIPRTDDKNILLFQLESETK